MFSGEHTFIVMRGQKYFVSCPVNAADDGFGQCSRKKLFCDGLSPCESCSGRGERNACLRGVDRNNEDRRAHCELLSSEVMDYQLTSPNSTFPSYDARRRAI